MKMAAVIPPDDEVFSSVGVEEGRREGGREQSMPLQSLVGVKEGRREVEREVRKK